MLPRNRLTSAGLALCLIVVAGCANLGLVQPQSFDQQIAYAFGVHTAVLETASAEVSAKSLSVADGNQVLRLADQSRTLLDSAKELETNDLATAQGKLTLATTILTQLQNYLQKFKGK
jgi:hypothetical protein